MYPGSIFPNHKISYFLGKLISQSVIIRGQRLNQRLGKVEKLRTIMFTITAIYKELCTGDLWEQFPRWRRVGSVLPKFCFNFWKLSLV